MANEIDMTPIKQALVDLAVSIIHGLKILVVYIIPSTIVAVLVSPQLMQIVSDNPAVLAYAPVINLIFSVVADLIKNALPKNKAVQGIL